MHRIFRVSFKQYDNVKSAKSLNTNDGAKSTTLQEPKLQGIKVCDGVVFRLLAPVEGFF